MKCARIIPLISTTLILSACAAQYDSKYACEKGEASLRGGSAGWLAGYGVSDGKNIILPTVTGQMVGKTIAENEYDKTHPKEPDDVRPYEGWMGKCSPKSEADKVRE